jgi:hypothetical protein
MSNMPTCNVLDGIIEWRFDGVLHRLDGPARIWLAGHKEWWVNGKFHRENGPAIEWNNGANEWWFNGKCLGKNEEGFWALWEFLNDEQRSHWELLQWAPWVK